MPTSRTVQTTNTSPTSQPDRPYFGTQMTARQGGYDDIGWDSRDSQDLGAASDRVRQIFVNRDVGIGTEGESEQDRIARIAQQVVSGERTFGDVRQSVDRIAQNADRTRASAGLPAVTQPQLSPEQIDELGRARMAASSQFRQTEADALEAKSQARFQAELQTQRLLEQYERMRKRQMDEAGDVGMAFQPVGAGRAMRSAAEGEARDTGEVEARLGQQLSMLAERVAAARRQRDMELSDLEAREQAMRSALVRDELANFGGY